MGTRLLDDISKPLDFRNFSVEQLRILAEEVRDEVIATVSKTGGHLGAGLGVVELTIALHYVFNTPEDRLIWDVGHQAYPHKILTGRRERMPTLRQSGGLSGFTRRSESPYDPFGAGHSSTSISAGLGMAVARDLKKEERNVIAVIGDGSMSAGMAYEAMNNAAETGSRLIVILNDNDMSIAPPVGAMSAYLSRLLSSGPYQSLRVFAKDVASMFPPPLERMAKQAEEYARSLVTGGGTLFEEMGFYYVGPLDGHNLNHLLPVLRNVRDSEQTSPVLIHVVTRKGNGYPPAEAAADKYHGVGCFNVETGELAPASSAVPSYTEVFGRALVAEARMDPALVAITAAMPTGTGLDHFAAEFPERMFDVGIAEQHAVTFAAGLACEGMKPVCALYSSFLQRGYDQLVHDVALQNLPVRFAIDRAGLVGADGATHAGAYDLAFLGCIPNMVLMAPADEVELMHMVATSVALDEHPSAFRYPRGAGVGLALPDWGSVLPLGKGRVLREGTDAAILCLGPRLAAGMQAAEMLGQQGIQCTVADARFMKPLDHDLILRLAREHPVLVTVEEGSIGGFAAHVMQLLALEGALDRGLKIRPLTLPDRFIEHDTMTAQYKDAGLDAAAIAAAILGARG